MANIQLEGNMKYTENSADVEFGTKSLDNNDGDKYVKLMQTVITTEVPIDLGDVTIPGYIMIINRDGTNFVSIRAGTGESNLLKIGPGQFALFQIESAAPYIIADTATCVVEYLLLEA